MGGSSACGSPPWDPLSPSSASAETEAFLIPSSTGKRRALEPISLGRDGKGRRMKEVELGKEYQCLAQERMKLLE